MKGKIQEMMKNKIAIKLTFYFSIALLVFSVLTGSVFTMLFRNHTVTLQKNELENRAVTMASTLSTLMEGTGTPGGMMGGQGGYGAYLRFLDQIAMADVWIVDENLQLITSGKLSNANYQYTDLPQDAEKVVKEVFEGKTTFSRGFSELLDAPALTVGTPILSNGKVVGALLLHSPVSGLNEALTQGYGILAISILAALILAVVLSVVLALAFTKPLKKMKNSALLLASGDYSVKTGVHQKDEIGELAESIDILSMRLDAASRESEKLLQLRRDFVANISHELRTPVTVIRGSLEALCDQVVTEPEQVAKYHRQMLDESKFLQRLVNDLLDLSRLQNAEFKMEFQEQNLCEILQDVVRSARHMAMEKQIEIKQVEDSPICTVSGDYGRLRQMFLIILDNAIKFSPQNGVVTIRMKEKTVSIRDNGVGIPEKDVPYIFDRFYKVKSQENKNGTGLGLSIAKQIAERHHVQITVVSKINEGTEFQFQF